MFMLARQVAWVNNGRCSSNRGWDCKGSSKSKIHHKHLELGSLSKMESMFQSKKSEFNVFEFW